MYKKNVCKTKSAWFTYLLRMLVLTVFQERELYTKSKCMMFENFSLIETSSLPVKGCKFWPLSSEGYLACDAYCDTGHPFIKVVFLGHDTHSCCRAFSSGTVTTCFNNLGLSPLGIEHLTFRMRGERSDRLRHRRGPKSMKT